MTSPVLQLACELISRESVTPGDAGCQQIIADRLTSLGFEISWINHGDTTNLWARLGASDPLFCFLGHTDVVPAGDPSRWSTPPFEPTVTEDQLFGRGAVDMKSSVAAFVAALEGMDLSRLSAGSIAVLLTSDEEGRGQDGIRRIVPDLVKQHPIRYCLVGEPTSSARLGDVIRNGRRGSLSGRVCIHGKQGHVAYPELAANAIHLAAPALKELSETIWDEGNDMFPPSTFQLVWIESGVSNNGRRADNVVPGTCEFEFNLRYGTASTVESLQNRVQGIFASHGLEFDIEWRQSAEPFVTEDGHLLAGIQRALKEICGQEADCSTGGGTSDGRFIAPTGAEVIELGPLNATAHAVDEHISVRDLEQLELVYRRIIENVVLDT